MTYNETINWMFNQLPVYQNIGKSAYKADLFNIKTLVNYLGHPESKIKTIHVAGTNGKGSSSHMLASILQEAGYNVGLYTSPHLKDFRERIKINGKLISKQYVIHFVKKHKWFFEKHKLSFFEMTFGMALDYFAKKKVDIAVIEVGLGGRLDATNVIMPEVSLITNIGMDHMQFLGNTLESIAKEKAGVIKPSVPVVVSQTQKEVSHVFTSIAKQNNSSLVFADQIVGEVYETDLLGDYQKYNVRGVVAAIHQLDNFDITDTSIRSGLLKVVDNTRLLGRWQILEEGPKVIVDTAHNVEGLTITMKQLLNTAKGDIHIVFGMVSDKSIQDVLALLPNCATYYFCSPDNKRALPVNDLYSMASEFDLSGKLYLSVKEAFKNAKLQAKKDDVVYVGGSTFVVAEII